MANNRKLLRLSTSFWPVFFTSQTMVRLIGGSTCFCLTDRDSQRQTIVVCPESDRLPLPSDEEILTSFPLQVDSSQSYKDPLKLPADYAKIRTWEYLEQRVIVTRRRLVQVLSPVRSSQLMNREADIRLSFIRFWKATPLQIARLTSAIGEDRLWFQRISRGDTRILVALSPGDKLNIGERAIVLDFGQDTTQQIIPVPNEGVTA